MHLECFVEEPSAAEAMRNLFPKIVPPEVSFEIHVYNGKPDLIYKLPSRLKGYKGWMPNDFRILVLIDEDRQDCHDLKSQLEQAAGNAGLITKSSAGGKTFQVLNRIIVEELEAWFFGDIAAVQMAYSRINPHLGSKKPFRKPDEIAGGTWESLERVLQQGGYFPGGLAKIEAAREISKHMEPSRNTSPSFQTFLAGLKSLLEE